MLHRLGLTYRNQKGSALTELLIAITVAALIAIAVAMGVFQIVTGNARTSNHLTAVRQVQEAGYWVSHDTQMSAIVSTTPGNGFPLTLQWQKWDGSIEYEAVYSLQNTKLHRSYSVNDVVQSSGIIAEYIDLSQTNCNFTGDELIFTVRATIGSGSQQGSETRVYKIKPRPGF